MLSAWPGIFRASVASAECKYTQLVPKAITSIRFLQLLLVQMYLPGVIAIVINAIW